ASGAAVTAGRAHAVAAVGSVGSDDVRRTGRAHAVAVLRRVAGADGRATDDTRVARGMRARACTIARVGGAGTGVRGAWRAGGGKAVVTALAARSGAFRAAGAGIASVHARAAR